MTDEAFWQIEIPESFVALFVTGAARKPNATRAHIAARYEVCEDVACGLHDPALSRHRDHAIAAAEVLAECHRGLSGPESGLSVDEALWVTRRLAELLGWPLPADGKQSARPKERQGPDGKSGTC